MGKKEDIKRLKAVQVKVAELNSELAEIVAEAYRIGFIAGYEADEETRDSLLSTWSDRE